MQKEITLGTGTGQHGSSTVIRRSSCFGKWAVKILNDIEDNLDGSHAQQIGSVYHYFWDLWMKGEEQDFSPKSINEKFKFLLRSGNEVEAHIIGEGLRLISSYILDNGTRNEFGTLLPNSIEMPVALKFGKNLVYTTAIDAAFEIGEIEAKVLSTRYELILLPGVYILDNKTDRAHEKTSRLKDLFNPQFKWLPRLYEATTGQRPRGVLVNHISKTKNPSRWVNFVPYNEGDEDILDNGILENDFRAIGYVANEGTLYLNPTACVDAYSVCSLGQRGICPRTNLVLTEEQKSKLLTAWYEDKRTVGEEEQD